jgi:D-aspartate ligase
MRQHRQLPGVVVLGSDFKALGFVRSLGRHGVPAIVVDNQPRSAWFSRYISRRVLFNGSMEDSDFADFLIELGHAHNLSGWMLVAAQDDAVEVVSTHYDALSMIYHPATPPWDVVRWAFDKRLTHRLAEEVGVAYPGTWYPSQEKDLDELELRFPAIIKPAVSIHMQHSARLKALPARNLHELHAQYQFAIQLINPLEIMVQEIIPGAGQCQVSVATLCQDGKVCQAMTARRLRQYPIDYGLGSSFVQAVCLPELFPPAERLLSHMRASGMVEVEFKQDSRDGIYKLLDINVRPWGWHTLCIACGLDLPYIQYRQELFGETIAPITPRYGKRWIRVATDLFAGMQELRAGITTPGDYARSLVGRNTYSVANLGDPLPALGDMATLVLRSAHAQYKEAYP